LRHRLTGRRAALALLLAAAAWSAQAGLLDLFKGGDDTAQDDGDTGPRQVGGVSLPAGARTERDLAYGSDPQQKLDAYIPASPANPANLANARQAPIILMVHGGAWMLGDKGAKNVVQNKVAHWLPRGVIVVSTNYRLDRSSPSALQQVDDLAHALAFVQKNAAAWGGDPARVVLIGHSSGAHLVSMLAADPRLAERAGARPWLGTVQLDSAVFDLVEIMERRHYGFYDRVFGKDPLAWRENSPYHRLSGTPKPMLLVCSSQRSDSCPQAQKFAARVGTAGGRVSVLPIDLKHAGINAELGADNAYTGQVDAFLKTLGLP
jgi:acetyl esterase/lipase